MTKPLTARERSPMPDTAEEAADWAADFVLETLAEALGVDSYDPCDGTETWDGDVAGTAYEILRTAGVLDDENEVARHAEIKRLRAELASAYAVMEEMTANARKTRDLAQEVVRQARELHREL